MIPIPIPIPRVDTEKKPEHVGEGLLQGLNKWSDHVGDGARKLWQKPQEGHEKEGALGAAKGLGMGMLHFANGVGKGTCDFLSSTIEGVRHTPDAVADRVSKDRHHNKHGVEGDGQGDLLESYKDEKEEEPQHLGEGVVAGVTGLGRGLADGFKDLTSKPMEGARKDGAMGFAKGLGQGALGFGTKATSGTLDLASSLLAGAKNTPDAIGKRVQEFQGGQTSASAAASSSSASASSSGGRPFASSEARPEAGNFKAFSGSGNVLGTKDEDTNEQS
mmetsp:Transcript_59804/g.129553  ORF Transcript_59804/g.129553 Transcript_59804/m.129553 type:complete len:275 (+) Transcript_59804:117-941(+)|eukprot:CAMPEP_0170602846 /NCGR_PEP_ID=MMETSP0224-20130122/18606_1 /TAXON_ID=285029 /ORGANISM="Togula jolla, Strain CCCM 725" /LENGTH=274 /DNA_ID=CAMNT_0010927707 /DNA_START=81 /DNA_END=905 /DNA_ORIENTATION=-